MHFLRFASDLTLQQIGSQLGKSEPAAQRHLQRVLEKLAIVLHRRGVTTSATALALLLEADFAKAAPTIEVMNCNRFSQKEIAKPVH